MFEEMSEAAVHNVTTYQYRTAAQIAANIFHVELA